MDFMFKKWPFQTPKGFKYIKFLSDLFCEFIPIINRLFNKIMLMFTEKKKSKPVFPQIKMSSGLGSLSVGPDPTDTGSGVPRQTGHKIRGCCLHFKAQCGSVATKVLLLAYCYVKCSYPVD